MVTNKISVVGKGHVGSCMLELFPDAIVYDKYLGIGKIEDVKDSDFIFVCVPTPEGNFGECNTSAVDEVLSSLNEICKSSAIVIIRSTVPVGYTHVADKKYGFGVVFQPEYYGETNDHPFADPHNRSWITLGGELCDTSKVAQLYQEVFNSNIIIHQVNAKTAELAKYMENCFYATKVTFCNQFYDFAKTIGVDYNQLRETWLLDPRIGRSHTFVFEDNRGYGGSCLPKDMAAMIYMADDFGVDMPLLTAVKEINDTYHLTDAELLQLTDDPEKEVMNMIRIAKLMGKNYTGINMILVSDELKEKLQNNGYKFVRTDGEFDLGTETRIHTETLITWDDKNTGGGGSDSFTDSTV